MGWSLTNIFPGAVQLLRLLKLVDGPGSGLDADTVDGTQAADLQTRSERGAADGYASLDSSAQVPLAQIPTVLTDSLTTLSGSVSTLQSDLESLEGDYVVFVGLVNGHINDAADVHGVTGSVVGTTDAQTLSGKTISGSDNTFTDIPQSAVTGLVADLGAKNEPYVHVQLAAVTVWMITHNLNRHPSVTVVDSGGTAVGGQVLYIDPNTVTVTFSSAFSGRAYLN